MVIERKISHRTEADYMKYAEASQKSIVEDNIVEHRTEEMARNIKLDKISKLRNAYQNQDITLFLGAGVSMDAGGLSWVDLICNLLTEMLQTLTPAMNILPNG
ncbi:hypothetical protein FACS189490_00240 [Clostridia bacterium]|nr:hypothetical protein FACS189490_00240 [Clostridia bacterium]